MKTREEYAKEINWSGTATRLIQTHELPDYKVGGKINPGLCWTDGGEFIVETTKKYQVLFVLSVATSGHEVDYDDEDECYALDCEDCSREREILINKTFEIVDVSEYDEDANMLTVTLK